MLRHIFVGNDVADGHSAAKAEHSKNLSEELSPVRRTNKIQHAVRYNAVDAFIGDHRLLMT